MLGNSNEPSDAALDSPTAFVRELCGDDFFSRVDERFCGSRVYIPVKPKANSVICEIMTLEQATSLASIHAGGYLDIPRDPNGRMRSAVIAQLKSGLGATRIANAVKCSRSTVLKVKAELRAAGEL